uniref:Uncharacterized protein n=1 Tax=Rhizophora mucronata TaxID=61149 RepID=A0A2P2QU90_RHIMU
MDYYSDILKGQWFQLDWMCLMFQNQCIYQCRQKTLSKKIDKVVRIWNML